MAGNLPFDASREKSQVIAQTKMQHVAVVVGLTEVSINDALIAAGINEWMWVTIQHLGSDSLFFGGTGVLASTGTKILDPDPILVPSSNGVAASLIADAAGQDVRICAFI